MNTLRISLPLLVFLLCLMGCGEEADRFDFSKVIEYEFTRDAGSLSYDATDSLDIVDNGSINDYRDYAESYQVNKVMYEIQVVEGNEANTALVSGTVVLSGEDTFFFEIADLSAADSSEGELELSDELLSALSEEIEKTGYLTVTIHSEADDTPAAFVFILKFDITVAVNFDLL